MTERDLEPFKRWGPVASCAVMRDKKTNKKVFGYVNFFSKQAAELAASKMAGVVIHGMAIKTSGPSELESKGHFSPPPTDFRPLIDCSFFIQGNICKNGCKVSVCNIGI